MFTLQLLDDDLALIQQALAFLPTIATQGLARRMSAQLQPQVLAQQQAQARAQADGEGRP